MSNRGVAMRRHDVRSHVEEQAHAPRRESLMADESGAPAVASYIADMTAQLESMAKAAGLDAARYSGHSLRSGHCTQAARSGVAEHIIMQQTGHRCAGTLKRYLRLGRIFEENSADALGL